MEAVLAPKKSVKQYLSTIEAKMYFIYAYLELFAGKPPK